MILQRHIELKPFNALLDIKDITDMMLSTRQKCEVIMLLETSQKLDSVTNLLQRRSTTIL